jgi:flagellar hook assembly protein FlgD
VRLAVYNLAGRLVRSLVDEEIEGGWQEILWDGRDDSGARIASGVYFCRLESRGSIASRKLVVLK